MANSTVVSLLLTVQELLTESFILYSTSVRPKCRSLVIKKINEQRTKRKPTTKIYKSKEQKPNKEWLEKGTFA